MLALAALALAVPTLGVAGASAGEPYGTAALKDEILSLPAAPSVPWRLFSGYIDVTPATAKPGSRQMFYWFVESQHEPAVDPVFLWTNGGPGCSGLGGFLSEQGPFRAGLGGENLTINEFAWSKVVNMVFIEQPVGVGFSVAGQDMDYGDDQAASDNHRFVLGFFERFPQFAKNDFFISSESYGGHYMPTLAMKLKATAQVPQFRGIFLGNPLTYIVYTNYGHYGTAWGHQLLPAPLWKRYEAAGCATTFPPTAACSEITAAMDLILQGFDPYALDFPTCNLPEAAGREERWMLRRTILRAQAAASGAPAAALTGEAPYEPCITSSVGQYLNRADVQAAIHVKSGSKWSLCSDSVGSRFNINDVNAPMMPIWQELITAGELKIMIYSGDDDAVCSTLASQQFIWDLGYAAKPGSEWVPWTVANQTAGFRTDFDVPSSRGEGAFSFSTVHGAGHMVPLTQPSRSLALLKAFLGEGSAKKPEGLFV